MNEGEKLKAKRKELGLTQGQLGALIGCSAQNICRFEAGKHPLKVTTMTRIAKGLSVDITSIWSKDEINKAIEKECGSLTQAQAQALQSGFEQISQGFDSMMLELYHMLSVRGRGDALLAVARIVDAEKQTTTETARIQAFVNGSDI